MSSSSSPNQKRHRPALIVLVVVAAIACLGLAWWQWGRFESASGGFQNLGYALQWPAFAVAVVYAYRRFVVMEADPDAVYEEANKGPTEIPEGILPERPKATDPHIAIRERTPDDDLADYNRYLTELNDRRDDA